MVTPPIAGPPVYGSPMEQQQLTARDFIDAWHEVMLDARRNADDPAAWSLPTPCPGWSVGDLIAHLLDIDGFMVGDPRPDHEPDWDALPHAVGRISLMTEVGVDARRGVPMEEVLAEFDSVLERRSAQLAAGTDDLTALVLGPFGSERPLGRVLSMRTFDAWVHAQDIRAARGLPLQFDTAAARITADQLISGLPLIWGKTLEAPPGTVLSLSITGPAVVVDLQVGVDDAGRGVMVTGAVPDVSLTSTWPDLLDLMTGRVLPDDAGLLKRIELTGDAELANKLLGALNVTP
jgi:uncharacterized protein (TIGR03083 family)